MCVNLSIIIGHLKFQVDEISSTKLLSQGTEITVHDS